MNMTKTKDAVLSVEIELEKASYMAERLSDEVNEHLKFNKELVGDPGETLRISMDITLDYMANIRKELGEVKKCLTDEEK